MAKVVIRLEDSPSGDVALSTEWYPPRPQSGDEATNAQRFGAGMLLWLVEGEEVVGTTPLS